MTVRFLVHFKNKKARFKSSRGEVSDLVICLIDDSYAFLKRHYSREKKPR